MPVTDALLYVHGTGTVAYGPITNTSGTYGDAICWAGTNGTSGASYSNLELDFGAVLPGTSSPYLPQFPSDYEKAYTFPPEVMDDGGYEFGLHIIVCQAFLTTVNISFQVCTSTATAALFNSSPNPIASRTLTLAQLGIPGVHYFIPVNKAAVREFLRFYAAPSTNPTAGTIIAWFGPKTGGEQ